MEDISIDVVPTGRTPAPKAFEYLPPRIDADMFQVVVPVWQGIILI
jgi:hypothetical protein